MKALLILIFMAALPVLADRPSPDDVEGWKQWGLEHCKTIGEGGVYSVPEGGHKDFSLVLTDVDGIRKACGRVDYGPIQRNAFLSSENGKRPYASACNIGNVIYLPNDGGAFMSMCHEMAHNNGAYNHGGIPFRQLWAHVTGNRELIDGRVYLYGKPSL